MKVIIALIFLSEIIISDIFNIPQDNKLSTSKLKSSNYAGVYLNNCSTHDGACGQIIIYPESDDSILFFIGINVGAPSYRMGSLYGRVGIKNGEGVYFKKFEFAEDGCKWSFHFSDSLLVIKTMGKNYDCGFGANVIADGNYKKIKNKQQDYFVDFKGVKYYFEKTKPEDYDLILK
jgi:hypothetical protein